MEIFFDNLFVELIKYLSIEDINNLLNIKKNKINKKKYYYWKLNEEFSILFYNKNIIFYNKFILISNKFLY